MDPSPTPLHEAGKADSQQPPKPKLLFLCQTLPYPPDGGVHIRSYHLIRLLSRAYRITALCFFRAAIRPRKEDVEASLLGLRHLADTAAFEIPQESNRVRWLWDHLRSVLTGRSYTVYAYQSREFSARLRDLLETRTFDVVHIDSLDLARYVPLLRGRPVVCGHHNIESALLSRRADVQESNLARAYMRLQARLIRREERCFCPRAAMNITCSPLDTALLESIAPTATVTTVPNGVDTQTFRAGGVGDKGIVFVGGYTWFPNRDGMRWFVAEILPLIRRTASSTPVTWVGRMPEGVGEEFRNTHGIDVTGFVEDIRPYVVRAACMIVPLRVGGGTRLKVLDGWAMGKAIVSTSVGCEGLDALDGQNILIADSPEAFAEATLGVLGNQPLRERLGEAARATAEAQYDWEVIGDQLLEAYHNLSHATRNPEEIHRGGATTLREFPQSGPR